MSLREQLDGAFLVIDAGRLTAGDILIRPARQITSVTVTATTPGGATSFGCGDKVKIFRPRPSTTVEECPQCGASAGEPCDPAYCLSLAFIDDAADEVFGPEGEQS
ncbi:hypothetical protein [Planobispora takensis]|uniref:Uncharacterized protein n=1 Tax=Planobispora takensis TaxID=1367882 RepID=A0A8J3SRE7_9ACTN|nr:hypothetical protein [Planobispora takensis]GIH99176.1 hypothetical protein Pta02_11850 [Planobispora takensis]